MGLFEIHCHTSEVSACGWVDAKSVVRMHMEAGFEGICITDHYHEHFFSSHKNLKASEIADKYLTGFRIARDEGRRIGLKVYLGMEIKFTESPNDYLVYGVAEELLYENTYMFRMSLKEFSLMARAKGLLLIQAHPFRDGMVRVNPALLDGMETLNANLRHNARNHLANAYAEENNLVKIGDSDFHQKCDINLAAMEFKIEINNSEEMVNALRNGEYNIVHNPF